VKEFFPDDQIDLPQKFEEQSEDWEKIEEVNRQLQLELNANFEKKGISTIHLKKASIAGSIFNDSYLGNIQDIKDSKIIFLLI
jgi:hypothetical protein